MEGGMDAWMDGRMNTWMDGRMNAWMDGGMDVGMDGGNSIVNIYALGFMFNTLIQRLKHLQLKRNTIVIDIFTLKFMMFSGIFLKIGILRQVPYFGAVENLHNVTCYFTGD